MNRNVVDSRSRDSSFNCSSRLYSFKLNRVLARKHGSLFHVCAFDFLWPCFIRVCMCVLIYVCSPQTGSHADQLYGGSSLLPDLKVGQRCGSCRNLRTSWWLRVCGGETRPRPAGSTYHPWPAGGGRTHWAGWECQLQTKDHNIS